ncbi:MAG: YlmH/Sll1252 family protein [Filifactor alocis]|nr:YlmH/Sll1252 family protein [Filifactor alocis]
MKREEKITRTSHIGDEALREKLFHILDLAQKVQYTYRASYTEFLTPYEQRQTQSILAGLDSISCSFTGGLEDAERKIGYIYPDYEEDEGQDFLSCLKITGNFSFRKVNHRDYLGSILSLGIKREAIGDIFVTQEATYVVCLKTMAEYIRLNLEKVANVGVKVSFVTWEEAKVEKPDLKEHTFVVGSQRLDAIVAGMFKLSRSDAQKLISSERVQADYQMITNPSRQVEAPCVISVKGYGKGRFEEVISRTKKDRLRLRTLIYR